ncbi:family 10 glycosylhydrolase [Erwinia sp. CPCC 100877]|nr:family 10 glycosylhydrolase [Erwinia sp. CPCC 100877]
MAVRTGIISRVIMVLCVAAIAGCSHKPPEKKVSVIPPTVEKASQPMRGVWLTTVSRLDWPPVASLHAGPRQRMMMQKQALTDMLDNLVRLGINTVFFQVKPDGTALYHSAILPWSDVMTGTVGEDPGYDPLAFVLQEARKRGLKVHAWLNPYRVTMNTRPATVAALEHTRYGSPSSVWVTHRDWIRIASDRYVLDPGLPEVRDWITGIVTELIDRYDVDGIQFDDYFYYETPQSRLDDNQTWRRYGQTYASKADWRRNNTLLLIKQVSKAIKTHKPGVEFGISPAGVWRNRSDDPRGSDTRGAAAYDQASADTRQWVELGLLDYIAPQLYWPFSRKAARYDELARWWAGVVRPTHTRLYIGVALYKVGTPSQLEPDWTIEGGVPELKRQLDLNDRLPEISGTILFREDYLNQPQGAAVVNYLKERWAQ